MNDEQQGGKKRRKFPCSLRPVSKKCPTPKSLTRDKSPTHQLFMFPFRVRKVSSCPGLAITSYL